ncbi:MAG: nitroreductase [Candidatus Brocadiaceae bacterium]|nr:nitroreductase [Candidatus Brocadiaceae bacterium]
MEFTEVVARRRSIRKYSRRAVSARKLRLIQKALQLAPSGGNKQDYAFVFVTDPEKRRRIAEQAGHQDFIAEAPVIMAAVCKPGGEFNVAIAVDHLILAATDQNLGTCWIGWFEREPLKAILGIPDDLQVAILVTIGHPAEAPDARPRKPLGQLVMDNEYRPA